MRGVSHGTKVHYKGQEDDFVVIVESAKAVQDWKADKSVPLAQVVNGWKIFCTHKHGAQGILDAVSNASLEYEFGTHKEEDVMKQILEKGDIQATKGSGRDGDRNESKGPVVGGNVTGVHN